MAEEDEDVVVGAEKVGKSEDVAERKSVVLVAEEEEEDVVQHAEAGEDVVVVVEADLRTREETKREEETRMQARKHNGKTEVSKP